MTTKTTTTTKLTPTQEAILKAAASRPDGDIEPLPDNVTPGVRQRVIDGMLSRSLVMRFPGGIHRISSYGYQCIGMEPPRAGKAAPKKRGRKKSEPSSKTSAASAVQADTGATTPLATAILDRLLHHSQVINIKGRSYRLRDIEQAMTLRN